MTSASADPVSTSTLPAPVHPLRLRRGWVGGCTDHEGITFSHRQRLSECCLNGERAWFLADGETFLGAFFDLGVAQRIRDAANRCAAFLRVDNLLARSCEEHPTQVEVGLFRGDEFEHLVALDRPVALELLISLLESLEASMKAAPTSSRGLTARYDAPSSGSSTPGEALPGPLRIAEASPTRWRVSCSNITTHRMLQRLHRLAPRIRRLEKAIQLSLTRLELLFSDQCYGRSVEEFIINLLADARHFCDAHELDMAALDRRAYTDYLEELHGVTAREIPAEDPAPPALHIPGGAWKDISDRQDRSVLTTTVLIDGVSHHLKAIQVQEHDTMQCAVDVKAEEELAEVHAACGASGPFETVSLDGRDYIMTLTPHSR